MRVLVVVRLVGEAAVEDADEPVGERAQGLVMRRAAGGMRVAEGSGTG